MDNYPAHDQQYPEPGPRTRRPGPEMYQPPGPLSETRPRQDPAGYRGPRPQSRASSPQGEQWSEPRTIPDWSRTGQYPRDREYDTGEPGGHAARTRPRDTQVYPGRAQAHPWARQDSAPRPGGGGSPSRQWGPELGRPVDRLRPGGEDARRAKTSRLSPSWVSALVLSMLVGLVLVQIADSRAIHGANPVASVYLFLVGLSFVFLPSAARILSQKTARTERLALVILLGIAFYVVKIQASPDRFLLNDEFIHLRNTQNVLSSGHLFQYNPLLPTAAYYPGLATITATLTDFTGLSIFVSGLIIIGSARVLISACLYLVAEKVTGSSRGAGAASLLYATNSMFLFWSAQFTYEDLALPLAAFIVWWIARTRGMQRRAAAQVVTVVAIIAVTVTHHISAFALCAILAVLYVTERIFRYPSRERRYLGFFALLTGVLAAFWFFVVAKPAASYLFGQNLIPAMQGMISALSGHGGRQLYGGGGTAEAPPQWYVYSGFAAILIIMGALLPAAIRAWRILRVRGFSHMMRRRAAIVVATLIALTFPITLLPRLTSNGSAISGRTSEFIFAAIGCTLGLLMEGAARSKRLSAFSRGGPERDAGLRTLVATLCLSIVFVGQISIGNSFFDLLPFKGVGFPAYIQPDMISAADWSGQHLGVHQTFAADSTNVLALATYGQENPVNVNVIYPIFFTANMDSTVVGLIKENELHYVLLDLLATQIPPVQPDGSYYSALEPDASLHGKPLPMAYYSKFAAYTCSRLVYHSGSIEIYDVSQIARGTCVPRLIHKAPSKAQAGARAARLKAAP